VQHSSAFEAFDNVLTRRIQKVVLGQTLTSGTDGVGSRALGEVHRCSLR
jgi:phage gp29-like protein